MVFMLCNQKALYTSSLLKKQSIAIYRVEYRRRCDPPKDTVKIILKVTNNSDRHAVSVSLSFIDYKICCIHVFSG